MYRNMRGSNPRAEKTGEGGRSGYKGQGEGPGTASCELGSSLLAGLAHAGLEGLEGHTRLACRQVPSVSGALAFPSSTKRFLSIIEMRGDLSLLT